MFRDGTSTRIALTRLGHIALTVAALVCAGCATFDARQRAECSWLEVESQLGLTASGPRHLSQDHIGPHQCGSIDRYSISRAGYTLEVWNGDGYSPGLLLRVTGAAGAELFLDGSALERNEAGSMVAIPSAKQLYPYTFQAHRFVAGQPEYREFPFTLELRVLNRDGEALATERLTIVIKKGYFFFSDL